MNRGYRKIPTRGDGEESPPLVKNLLIPHPPPGKIRLVESPTHTKFSPSPPQRDIKTSFLTVVIFTLPFFILCSCSLYTQVILFLILIDVQYIRNVFYYPWKRFEWSNPLILMSPPPDKKNPPS